MQSEEIRNRFLEFFKKRGHAIIPSSSLVPQNDPSVLFNTAGMQPLVPYLMGTPHPAGNKLVNVQKCVRTQDIEAVGDNTHDTFFEMLGNWSLGAYFKKEAISWSYEFITSKVEGLGLDPNRLYITVFGGNDDAPKDTESFEIWKSVGVPEHRIYFMSFADDGKKEPNWWSPGDNGPCGPDSEMFYDITKEGLGDMNKESYIQADKNQHVVEFWNDVFMEYEKKEGKVIGKLKQQNVDTGGGLERMTMLTQRKNNIFDTDLFQGIMDKIGDFSITHNIKAKRILADHIRTSVFLIADGVTPSNNDQGYILRRLLRRAIRFADMLQMKEGDLPLLAHTVIEKYESVYPILKEHERVIEHQIREEEQRFRKTLQSGLKEFNKLSTGKITGHEAFTLFSTYGFPFEMTKELAHEKNREIDEVAFKEEMEKHHKISRVGAERKFKGGLSDTSEMSIKYHTATHLLHKALREVLGENVSQKGSNITSERLRFDFTYGHKMTDEEKKKVEDLVNEKIKEALPVTFEDLPLEEAKSLGAIGLFEEKYGDRVRVYKIGASEGSKKAFSLEFCGGPHVENTADLGSIEEPDGSIRKATFKIEKEEAISSGVRRIKAILE